MVLHDKCGWPYVGNNQNCRNTAPFSPRQASSVLLSLRCENLVQIRKWEGLAHTPFSPDKLSFEYTVSDSEKEQVGRCWLEHAVATNKSVTT